MVLEEIYSAQNPEEPVNDQESEKVIISFKDLAETEAKRKLLNIFLLKSIEERGLDVEKLRKYANEVNQHFVGNLPELWEAVVGFNGNRADVCKVLGIDYQYLARMVGGSVATGFLKETEFPEDILDEVRTEVLNYI